MAYDPKLRGCFGERDLIFAGHPLDNRRAFAWLTSLRDRQVLWADAKEQIEKYLREQGAGNQRIGEEVDRARKMLAFWLPGPGGC